jgi:hypothetical protein
VYRSTTTAATVSVKKTKVGSSYAMVDFLIIMRCIYPLLVAATLISFEGKEPNRSPANGSDLFWVHMERECTYWLCIMQRRTDGK